MEHDPEYHRSQARKSNKLAWIAGGIIIAVLVIIALQGLIRGTGEAVGIESAAPGDDNAHPAPDTKSPAD